VLNRRILPATHGSLACLHVGETQGLVVDHFWGHRRRRNSSSTPAMHGNFKSNFMLPYNFPPTRFGEVGAFPALASPKIGHGKWLARVAGGSACLTDFPYTIRVVSENH